MTNLILITLQAEMVETQSQSTDFFECVKVDTHIHLAAAASVRTLLNFMKSKAREEPDLEVFPDTKLSDVLPDGPLTADSLRVQADETTFKRFDNFNGKYNIMGDKNLRSVFLKSENHFGGRFFAELSKEVLDQVGVGVCGCSFYVCHLLLLFIPSLCSSTTGRSRSIASPCTRASQRIGTRPRHGSAKTISRRTATTSGSSSSRGFTACSRKSAA